MNSKTRLAQKALADTTTEEEASLALDVLAGHLREQETASPVILSVTAAAEYASISRVTLWKWTKKGLRYYQVGGRRYFRKEDIRDYILSNDRRDIV